MIKEMNTNTIKVKNAVEVYNLCYSYIERVIKRLDTRSYDFHITEINIKELNVLSVEVIEYFHFDSYSKNTYDIPVDVLFNEDLWDVYITKRTKFKFMPDDYKIVDFGELNSFLNMYVSDDLKNKMKESWNEGDSNE